MKLSSTLLRLAFGLAAAGTALTTGFAAEYVVNNSPGDTGADFSDLQAAIDAAAPGDTLYVVPSTFSYGEVNLTKTLTLIGGGYGRGDLFPLAGPHTSEISVLIVESTADGSVLTGLNISDELVCQAAPPDELDDIVIYRNLIANVSYTGGNNINAPLFNRLIIVQNIFEPRQDFRGFNTTVSNQGNVSSALIQNNIIHGGIRDNGGQGFTGVMEYNTILSREENRDEDLDISKLVFRNNLVFFWKNTSSWGYYFSDGQAVGNLFYFPQSHIDANTISHLEHHEDNLLLPQLVGNNEVLSSQGLLFTDVFDGNGVYGQRYVLAADTPALTAGIDSGEVGAFGGPDPFDLSHQPPIPIVNIPEGPVLVAPGETLEITIEANAND